VRVLCGLPVQLTDSAAHMDLFGSESDESDGEAVRPEACGVLQFHNGTEDECLRVVKAEAKRGEPASVLATVDRFCRSRHWMMHVGDVKGRILRGAASSAAPGLWVELGAYCGYSAVLLASQMPPDTTLMSLDTEAPCVAWSRQLVEHAGFADRVKVMQSSPDETAADALRREAPAVHRRGIQLLFVDHAKDRYLADLISLEPFLAKGCVVIADNVLCFDGGASLKPYLAHVRDESRYASSTLHEAPVEYSDGEPDGVEVSVFRGVM